MATGNGSGLLLPRKRKIYAMNLINSIRFVHVRPVSLSLASRLHTCTMAAGAVVIFGVATCKVESVATFILILPFSRRAFGNVKLICIKMWRQGRTEREKEAAIFVVALSSHCRHRHYNRRQYVPLTHSPAI